MAITLQVVSVLEKLDATQVCLRDHWSMWMQDGCKVYMDSYMTSNGSCFMVTWIILKNDLLEVRLTQIRKTIALRITHNRWRIIFYHVWGPAWIKFHWNSIWLTTRSNMTSHYTWGYVTTPHDFGGVLGQPSYTFFRAVTISWSRLLARTWSGLRPSHRFGRTNPYTRSLLDAYPLTCLQGTSVRVGSPQPFPATCWGKPTRTFVPWRHARV